MLRMLLLLGCFPGLVLALAAVLLLTPVQAAPPTPTPTPPAAPAGLEPDLEGRSNGRIRAIAVRSADGLDLVCSLYEGAKLTNVQMGVVWRCDNEAGWRQLADLSAQHPGVTPLPLYGGTATLDEPRGILSADLVAAYGSLWLTYTSPRADDTNVNNTEQGVRNLNVPLDTSPVRVLLVERGTLPIVTIAPTTAQ
jgi:hypothetical protein